MASELEEVDEHRGDQRAMTGLLDDVNVFVAALIAAMLVYFVQLTGHPGSRHDRSGDQFVEVRPPVP